MLEPGLVIIILPLTDAAYAHGRSCSDESKLILFVDDHERTGSRAEGRTERRCYGAGAVRIHAIGARYSGAGDDSEHGYVNGIAYRAPSLPIAGEEAHGDGRAGQGVGGHYSSAGRKSKLAFKVLVIKSTRFGTTGAGVSPATVTRHIHNILTKTGLSNRTELARYAAIHGLAAEAEPET